MLAWLAAQEPLMVHAHKHPRDAHLEPMNGCTEAWETMGSAARRTL